MAGQGGIRVRVTGRCLVGDRVARPKVGSEGARPGGREIELSGSKVSEGDGAEDGGDIAVLAVEVGWGSFKVVSTQIYMLEYKVDFFSKT